MTSDSWLKWQHLSFLRAYPSVSWPVPRQYQKQTRTNWNVASPKRAQYNTTRSHTHTGKDGHVPVHVYSKTKAIQAQTSDTPPETSDQPNTSHPLAALRFIQKLRAHSCVYNESIFFGWVHWHRGKDSWNCIISQCGTLTEKLQIHNGSMKEVKPTRITEGCNASPLTVMHLLYRWVWLPKKNAIDCQKVRYVARLYKKRMPTNRSTKCKETRACLCQSFCVVCDDVRVRESACAWHVCMCVTYTFIYIYIYIYTNIYRYICRNMEVLIYRCICVFVCIYVYT